ncbi:Nose resistant to fluoxetine protein 6, partial [Araneus ventricosus]
CLIIIFVMLNVIGSSINAYESFRKAFPRKKNSGKLKDSKNYARRETQAESKMKSIESSSISVWRENCRKFFDCFCVQANARKILRVASKQENMDCIDGIRALFFLYIFAVHFFLFGAGSIKNLEKHIHVLLEMPITQIGAHGLFAIDALFVLSGFLNGYFFSDYFEKNNGKIRWVSFYAFRFLRSTPVYMILLGFYSTLFTYMSSSPIWPTYDTNPVCRETWIWNVLHINNFNTHYNQCMNTTWFLACLMQLYVISPLFMIPLNRWPRIGYVLSVVTICISSFACFIITKQYNLFGSVPKIELQSNALEEVNKR